MKAEKRSGDRLALRFDEAAATLGVCVATIERAVARKQLRVVRLGRRRLVPREELQRLLAAE